jgi:hypothetical protein
MYQKSARREDPLCGRPRECVRLRPREGGENMKRTLILVAGMLALVCGSLIAAGSTEDPVPAYEIYPKSLGFQYGEISGTGLSHHWGEGTTGYQIAAGGIYVPYAPGDEYMGLSYPPTTLDYTIGVEAQFRVYGDAFTNWLTGQLYLFAGLNHRGYIPLHTVAEEYLDESNPAMSVWVEPVYSAGVYTPVVGLGGGIGIELIFFTHFSIPIELGYAVQWSPTITNLAEQFTLNLIPQVGFRYRY